MHRRLLFVACFFVCVSGFSQQYPFVYYTPKDGLINSRVRSIRQDSRGRMHFITYGGLSIYDGTRFINYGQQDGLANEIVNDVIEVTADSFLVATNTRKLNTLVHDKIGVFETTDNFCPTINRFFKSIDGYWYAAADEGLFQFKDKKFTRILLEKNGKDLGRDLDKMLEWKDFFLIIPWNGELEEKFIVFNKTRHSVTDVITKERITSMKMDKEGVIWFVTTNGIKQADPGHLQKGQLVLRAAPPRYATIKSENTNIFLDPSGNFWFYGGKKIQKITRPFYEQVIPIEQGLPTGGIFDLFQDREGITWMATDGNGVIKLKSTNIQILNTLLPGRQMSFFALRHREDTTWFFNKTESRVYRLTGNEIKSFPFNKKMNVVNLYLIGNTLYLGDDKRIVAAKRKDDPDSYSNLQTVIDDPNLALGNGITDAHGSLIQYVRKDTGYLLCVIRNNKILMSHKIDYPVDQMTIDRQGHLWIATRYKHVLVFKINPSNPEMYLQLLKDFAKELPDISPRSITVDPQNNIWVGTRYDGLFYLKLKDLQLRGLDHFTTKNGLSDNFVVNLTCDSSNTVWIGTQTGLDKIFLKKGNYVIGNISQANNIFQTVSKIEIGKDGTVWAVNSDYTLLRVAPSFQDVELPPPPLLLTSLKVNNKVPEGTANSFSHKENNFSFSVAAPSFFDEKSIRYSYLLEGSGNNNWSEPSNTATFSMINLRPGSYTLRVRSDFPEAEYAPQILAYSFVIRQAWWQTWWFKASTGFLLAVILTMIIRNYYRRKLERQKMLLEKQQAIEKERTRIATDMHDDLGAGLSRIKFLSETIGIKKQQQQPVEEEITKIREYSHEMIDKMGEIVWALNERNDSLSDLIAYTRAYAVEYLSQNGIACSVETPDQLPAVFLSGELRRNIFLSVKEVLHNIVKHAQANHIHITVQTGKELVVRISDDGIGFSSSAVKPFSNGLYNIEKRMRDMGGGSKIESVNGTTVSLMAPLPY